MKKCLNCEEEKELSEFTPKKGSPMGVESNCKNCRAIKMVNKRYNLKENERDILLQKQNGVCAICKNIESVKHQHGKTRHLSIDHDHNSGKIRGLLCGACNNGLGRFKDNIELLENAIKYLKESNEK